MAFSLAFVIGAIYLIATTILGLHPDAFFTKAVVIAGAGLPAVAAALAGIRYQGDFYRFSERAAETARELQRIDNALKAFACWPENTWNSTDQFAELRDIIIDLEGVLLNDLDDWRFVYRARPTPEPG